jgi:hypothetical protein
VNGARRLTYSEKLKDPRWQKKRLEVFERDQWRCIACDAADKTLHVHHLVYLPKCEPWEYANCFLRTLCFECHEEMSGPDGTDYQGHLALLAQTALSMGEGPDNLHALACTLHSIWLACFGPTVEEAVVGNLHPIVMMDALLRGDAG